MFKDIQPGKTSHERKENKKINMRMHVSCDFKFK
jgi:hypothetical protein